MVPLCLDGSGAEDNKRLLPDILGISEITRIGQGHIVVVRATVLYSGKQDKHMHGFGLILCDHATQELVGWRLMNKQNHYGIKALY